jgi:hypothetical protein
MAEINSKGNKNLSSKREEKYFSIKLNNDLDRIEPSMTSD